MWHLIRNQVLLGLDFLRAADVTIQARGSLYVSGQRVKSQLINQAMSHWATPVRLEKMVVLQPETEYTVWGRNEDPRPDREGVLEPSTMLKGDCHCWNPCSDGSPHSCLHCKFLRHDTSS